MKTNNNIPEQIKSRVNTIFPDIVYIEDIDGNKIGVFEREYAAEIAAKIALCYNSHDKLVTVLGKLLDAIDTGLDVSNAINGAHQALTDSDI